MKPSSKLPGADTVTTISSQFKETLDKWMNSLVGYTYDQLCFGIPDSWSLGQVYMHLIEETSYFFEQAEECISTGLNAHESRSLTAGSWFKENSYPNEKMIGPPETQHPPQPESIEQVAKALKQLQHKRQQLARKILAYQSLGKTRHPGLGYFNAAEWFQFAEMHMRHHFKQKQRIESILLASNAS